MKTTYITFLLVISSIGAVFAQQNAEEAMVKQTINFLFDGMRNSDTTLIRKAFDPKSIMQTIARTKDGKMAVRSESVNDFIKSVGAPHPAKYDERIVFTKILIDANLASVWTDYKFYIGDNYQEQPDLNKQNAPDSSITTKKQTLIQWKFSHCGVNSFQLFKGEDGWKIIYLIDTRRKDGCE